MSQQDFFWQQDFLLETAVSGGVPHARPSRMRLADMDGIRRPDERDTCFAKPPRCGKDIYHLWHKTKLISYIALRNAFWKQLLSEVYIHIPVSTTC